MRHRYLDRLRVISALAVVAVHVLSHYLNGFALKSLTWTALMGLKHMTHFCIPVFFMITGALLIHPLGKMSYGEYLKKRFLRIGIPFLAWSAVHWLVVVVAVQKKPLSMIEFVRLFLSNGICSQYWYVYATLALYLFLPFIGMLVSAISRKQLKILIAVMVAVNLLLPFANEFLKQFVKWKLTNYNMSSLGAYLTYALIGYALHTGEVPVKKKRMLIYGAAAAAWLLMNGLVWVCSKTEYVDSFSGTQYPLSCLLGVALFTAFKALNEKSGEKKESRLVRILSAESYTAYLTHMLCLRLLQIPWKTQWVVSLGGYRAAAVMLAEWVLGTIGCFGIAYLVHKLPRRISDKL